MGTRGLFVLLALTAGVLSDGGGLLQSCKIKDIECLSKSTEQFLEKTCRGIPSADIRAIDPLVMPSFEYATPQVSLHFSNLNLTGLRNQKIYDFQMDKNTQSVVLKVNVDLNIVGEITIKSSSKSNSFSGIYTAKTTAIAAANYNYNLKVNDKGVRHFEVLPETITCNIVGKPDVSVNEDLVQALRKDENFAEWRERSQKERDEFRDNIICKIIEKAYVTVVHNIRAAAKFLPAEDFFQDV